MYAFLKKVMEWLRTDEENMNLALEEEYWWAIK